MNISQFIISFLQAVAWPAVVLVLVFTFRADLAALLSRLSSLKHKDTEFQFGRELAKAAEEVKKESAVGQRAEYLATPEAKKIMAILEIDPKSAVIAAWVEFEGAAREALLTGQATAIERPSPMPQVIEALLASGRLHRADADFLRVLRQLRNLVLHSPNAALDVETAYKAVTALLVLAWELHGQK